MSSSAPRKVLVVDDHPMIAKSIRRMLVGYDVTVVENGLDALARLEAGERYDAIITDLTMPGMTGIELHAAIERSMPEQVSRMVFMSGGAFTPQMQAFFDQVGRPLLEKPFDRTKLFSVLEPLVT